MLRKPITFEKLDGTMTTEDFYFHLSQAELAQMKISHGGNLEAYFRAIVKEGDAEKILAAFEWIILSTVGIKSDDGKRFIKDNGRIAREFKETDAYSVLFTELLENNGKNFQAFFTGVVPGKLQEQAANAMAAQDEIGHKAAAALVADLPPEAMKRLEREIFEPEKKVEMELPTADRIFDEVLVEAREKKAAEDAQDPPWMREKRDPTQDELLSMTPAQFAQFAKTRK